MKQIITLLILLASVTHLNAQSMDTVLIVHKAKKFKTGKHIKLRYEVVDTVDASGRSITMSRSYFFDKKNRMISSVLEYYNPRKPKKGTQVIYDFAKNKLTTVTIIPAKSVCRNCASEYYYLNDSLLVQKQSHHAIQDPSVFLRQARHFQSTLPGHLPWGYFEDEALVKEQRK